MMRSLRAAQSLASRSLLSVRALHSAACPTGASACLCSPQVLPTRSPSPSPSSRAVPTGVAGAVSLSLTFATVAEVKERPLPNLLPQSVVLYQYQAWPFCNKVREQECHVVEKEEEWERETYGNSSTYENNFNYSWHPKFGLTAGAVLVGQAAFFIGLSGGSALAQEDSVSLAAAVSEQTEGNAAGLQRIEDGSVVSNEHTVKWRIFTDSARDYFQKRQLDEAEKLFQAALHEAKEGFGLRDPHVASALNNLAEFYRLRKEYQTAELLYLEAIEILEESFGPDDIRVGTALHNLGICYHLQHKFSQAETCYERALKIEGRVMGLGHPEYASTMYLLAKALNLQGKRKDAESLIVESIRILEEAGLGESPTCIQRMRYVSMELLKSYRFPEAENWQRKILHALELSKGWDSLDTANAAGHLSLTFQSMEKFKESEELLERCLNVRRRILPEVHFMVAGTLVQLARLTMHKFAMDFKNINNDVTTSYLHRTKQLTDDSIRIADGILKSSNILTSDMNKIAATLVLLQALDVVGLLEAGVKQMLAPGEQDHKPIEEALNRCISLYKEPNTRSIVSKSLKQDYITCLRRLTRIVETDHVISETIKLQELLGEAQQIMEELGEASNRKK